MGTVPVKRTSAWVSGEVVGFRCVSWVLNSCGGISNAASARKALNRLAELRHIYKYRGEWRFNGNFFRAWLKRFA